MILALISFLLIADASAGEVTALDPIIVEGSTADALLYDPIVPAKIEKVRPANGSGSLVRDAEVEFPVPVTDFGTPGTTTQIRGLGRTVEDTNVQTLGVPLNPVVGGGFDFSSFPQFFWSSYAFHLGPSTGAFDPRASSGTFTLTPWTASALRGKVGGPNRFRLTEMVTRGLNQVSVAGRYENAAALVGVSSINAEGPTGSVSALLTHTELYDLRAHFLATSIDQTSPGSNQFPSPQARLKTTRWIPILEANFTPSNDFVIKESLFYDKSSLRFVNPEDHSIDSYDRSHQWGTESVALLGDWTLGFSLRQTAFTQIGGQAPDECIGHLQAERLFRAGDWTTQASVQGDWMNLYGARPGAMLGERYDINSNWGVFAKANFSYRYPTLQDRYYQGQSFAANPGLNLERALSFNFGNQWSSSSGDLSGTEQAYLQFRSDAQVLQYDPATSKSTVVNGGDVRQLSYLDDLSWKALPIFEVSNSLRLSYSKIERTGARIAYDPILTEIISGRFHEASRAPAWSAGPSIRTVTSSPDGLGGVNGGYALIDLDSSFTFLRSELRGGGLTVQGRIENLLDRPVQVIQGYPWPGRLFALSVMAAL